MARNQTIIQQEKNNLVCIMKIKNKVTDKMRWKNKVKAEKTQTMLIAYFSTLS